MPDVEKDERPCGFCGDVGCGRCSESDAMTPEQFYTAFPWWTASSLPSGGQS